MRLAIVLIAVTLAVATVLSAQETPPAAPAPATAAAAPGAAGSGDETSGVADSGESATGDAQDEGAAGGERPAETNPPAPAERTRPVGPTPGRFEPTEKVRADFDVAFPIDI